ncbi:hypothetical protein RUM43_002468 [Polyplax serrata]|uniref:Ribosome-recycling factor, mitochondrial n=1 Tax=Polyplax serrata TaxID=468196 RepID=A0AAN8PZJ7_POLSC
MLRRILPVIRRGILYESAISLSKSSLETNKINAPTNLVQNFHINCQHNAKGKDIKKNKKKGLYINEDELAQLFDTEKLFSQISQPVEKFKQELIDHTTLRTSQGAIQNVKVEFEGETYIIQDIAEIGKKNPKLYVLDLSAFPQMIPAVMSTLQKSHMNINVQQDGTKLFVPIPKVTREYREVLAKKANVYFVKCKENIRDVQLKYIKKLRNDESLSTEIKIRISDQLTALGDKNIQVAEGILKEKQDELLKNDAVS